MSKILKHKPGSGTVLMICIVVAIIIANSPLAGFYHTILHKSIALQVGDFILAKDLKHWINDGLMSIFFFTIGLEVKRELTGGHFTNLKKAILPFGGAIGGMLFPVIIFFIINQNTENLDAWGIPVATDIAIVLCILSLMIKGLPSTVTVFIAILAIFDDLGASLIIAFFYTDNIEWYNLIIALSLLGVMAIMNICGVRKLIYYALIGIVGVWFAVMLSGIHATIGGVLAALAIPGRPKIGKKKFLEKVDRLRKKYKKIESHTESSYLSKDQEMVLEKFNDISYEAETPLQKLEYAIKPVVQYIILPIFVLSSAGIEISENFMSDLVTPLGLGISLGLFMGKFSGISLFCFLFIKLGWGTFPEKMSWRHLYGLALLAGVGFTMSVFIAELGITDDNRLNVAKSAIIAGSMLSAVTSVTYFKISRKKAGKSKSK
ncbi:MAG: Na+/H+ antiporter NhaA [Brumimicrobium sp.]|nr:Na+/H+ antiporter NhaA [Brumimicrobium sp.]